MKITIAGAGAVGFHLAELLATENQDITIIDKNAEVLEHAATHLDVMTVKGDATSFSILEEANVDKTKLFIAVTTSESANILMAILAKQLGAKKTIARVDNPEYLDESRKSEFEELGVDILISPQHLAAQEIKRLLQQSSFTDVFEFGDGKMAVVGFTLDTSSPLAGKSVRHIEQLSVNFNVKGIAILRGDKTIIPKEETILTKGDHLYLAVQSEYIDRAVNFVGKQMKMIKCIMIIGGTQLALRTAELLEETYSITVVVNDKNRAKEFIEVLNRALVVRANPGNIDVLREEGLDKMDAFIALTPNAEINILTSLIAEEAGVYKTIASVDNAGYTHISQNIGIDTLINKKLIAANNIFRFVRKGRVTAIASLHGVDAEVIEFKIYKENRLIKHTLGELHLPEKAVIAGVVRGEDTFIPEEDFTLQLNDKIIVFAQPEAIKKVEEIFK
ncbi:MAG: Trk system potassium transporter TrkA [Saprospiraceae bacterium]|nr:Trk system potassium transporter TrkA [Saprospiraceae bacterium]